MMAFKVKDNYCDRSIFSISSLRNDEAVAGIDVLSNQPTSSVALIPYQVRSAKEY